MNPLLQFEKDVLVEGREWTRQRWEGRLQAEVDRGGRLCPRSQQPLEKRKRQRLTLNTCAGKIMIRSWRGYSPAAKQWLHPARERWGLKARQQTSPELEARPGFTATQTGAYQKAAVLACRWGTPVSDDLVHAVVQRLGGQVPALALPTPAVPAQEPPFSLVIMMDGWMARERGPDWGASARKKPADRVNWKEVKSAVIYRLEQRVEKDSGRGMLIDKYVVACPPDTTPVDFGTAVHQEALRRGSARARYVYVVMDGAVWLWDLSPDRFKDAILTLDFHHASTHLWVIAPILHGDGTPEAKAWVEPLLHQLRHGQDAKVVRRLEELIPLGKGRKTKPQERLATPVAYFQTHRDHIHYGQMAKRGAPIGSGSVESLCSQFQNRFKRTGQFWTRPGFSHLIALDVLVRNQDYDYLWN